MKLRFAWRPLVVQSQIMGMIVLAQFQTNMWTTQDVRLLTLDGMAGHFLLFAAINFAIVYAGDRLARAKGWWRRSAYCAIGAVAASASHYVAMAPAGYLDAGRNGVLFLLIAIPALLGAATAFLMHRSLGYSEEGDDPHALAAATPGQEAGTSGVHDIGSAQYYDGPLQLRTSGMAAFLAALVGSALYSLTVMFSLSDGMLPAGALPPMARTNPALMALVGTGFYSIFFFVFVRKAHAYLQSRGKDGVKPYALAGLVVPLGFALALTALMGPFGIMIVLPWVLPSVVAMISYHQLAGFEPLALPDDIEVSDPRTLVGADHIRRRVRRVIPTS